MRRLVYVCALIVLLSGALQAAGPFQETVFIDHYNLRKVYDKSDDQLRSQVVEIKKSLDKAKEYDIDTFILFSRSFETLINYDFEVAGLGELSGKVYPMDSQHRVDQLRYTGYFNEVINYADKLGIKVIMHTNQLDFPDSLYELAGEKISGNNACICPGKQLVFDLLRGKIDEFFTKFPKVSGIQLTLSETQAKVTDCMCSNCEALSEADRFIRVAEAGYAACKARGKTTMVRTWGHFEKPEIVDRIPNEIICSTKFTLPDFHLTNYPNPVMGQNGNRQEVEFDGWGEYSGYNLFPCYYGDMFAPRIKECAEKGVKSLGIRLNWEPGVSYIFGNPYGNEANIYVFSKVAEKPDGNPDDYLREYIAKVFPQSARDAAFRLYKRSADLQTQWLVWLGTNTNDHSRIYNGGVGRVGRQIGTVVPERYAVVKPLLEERRKQINQCYREAVQLVNDLGPDVDPAWKRDLLRGARTSWYVAQGNCDCIEMYAAALEVDAGRPMPDLTRLAENVRRTSAVWKKLDPEMHALMYGEHAERMLDSFPMPLGKREPANK